MKSKFFPPSFLSNFCNFNTSVAAVNKISHIIHFFMFSALLVNHSLFSWYRPARLHVGKITEDPHPETTHATSQQDSTAQDIAFCFWKRFCHFLHFPHNTWRGNILLYSKVSLYMSIWNPSFKYDLRNYTIYLKLTQELNSSSSHLE